MITLSNAALAGRSLCCYNPSLVEFQGRRLLFYRFTPERERCATQIAFVELGPDFRPLDKPKIVALPPISDRVVSYEDPRVVVFRDELWLLHAQSVFDADGWAAATALARVDMDGGASLIDVPALGNNRNRAYCADAAPAIDRNWTPLVFNGEFYIIYELNPLTVFRFDFGDRSWELVCRASWDNPWGTYLSGGTPAIPWQGSTYIGLFHTYKNVAGQQRVYSMGFYALDVSSWRITHLDAEPTLTGWSNRFRDRRPGVLRRLLYGSGHSHESLVVFPCGIVDTEKMWAVSYGWNDYSSVIELYDKQHIQRAMTALV